MPSKARAKRQASIPTTRLSRKLTKSTAKAQAAKLRTTKTPPAKVKPKAKGKRELPRWIQSHESILSPQRWAEVQATTDLGASWQVWMATENRDWNAAEAVKAIEFAELLGAGLFALEDYEERLGALKKIAEDATGLSVEKAPLTHQLLVGELRLKLGVITDNRELRDAALLSLIEGLEALLDGEGTPHKKYLIVFPDLVASWLRCFALVKRKAIAMPTLNEAQTEALAQCRWLPLRIAQLSRIDGSPIFAPSSVPKIDDQLITEGLKLWGDAADRKNAASIRTDIVKPSPKPAVEKIARAVCGDWSGLCVFRHDAKPDAAYLAVALEDTEFLLELGTKGLPLVSGAAKLTLARDGHSLAPTGAWEEVCRHQEPEVEYWELERTYERGVWLQRQVVLACKDQFAFINDNIVADSPGDLTYRLEVPLASGVSASLAPETREITLVSGKTLAPVIPLAAEEWQTTPSHFEFRSENGHLRFDGRTKQSRMSIPWVVDLRGGHKPEDLTWRRLRVAENLQNLPSDLAVAFRWQIGKQQWMAYRSLAAPSNRTVLGQNLIGDFLLARVFADGKTKTIVEIE